MPVISIIQFINKTNIFKYRNKDLAYKAMFLLRCTQSVTSISNFQSEIIKYCFVYFWLGSIEVLKFINFIIMKNR